VSSSPHHEDASPRPIFPQLLGVEKGYERWAATYDGTPNPLLAREERHLISLLPDLAGKNVLDLACGTGRWLQKLMGHKPLLGVGVDSSAAMLRIASRKAAVRGCLAQADCRNLPFRASLFDFAICSFAVSHIEDMTSLAYEVARVMKPASGLFITDLHSEAYARGWRTGFRDQVSAVHIRAVPLTAENLIPRFHAVGFECISHVSLCVGEPERAVFSQAGKLYLFEEACRMPAVLVCQFRRSGLARQRMSG
jgi:ubiquinone/menaquinone biosynthesis C-methylase UbiE